MSDLIDVWSGTIEALENAMDPIPFRTWIQPIVPVSINENIITLEVPFPFSKQMIVEKYNFLIVNALSITTGKDYILNVIVKGEDNTSFNITKSTEIKEENIENRNFENSLNPLFTFDNFIIGSSNKFAHAASLAVAQNPSVMYNPLFIYGGVGLGKTHLMHAIGNYIINKFSKKKVIYVSAEKFSNDFISALGDKKSIEEFREHYRSADVLLIDDIQFIGGKKSIEESFFYTFNDLVDNEKQIIISSDRPPKELYSLDIRVRTRFDTGLLADIQSPDFETRCAILNKKCEIFNVKLNNEQVSFIASSIVDSVRELEGVLKKLKLLSEFFKKEIDEDMINEALKDFNTQKNSIITPEIVAEAVEKRFNLKENSLKSEKKTKEISQPRQIAMYIMKEMCKDVSYKKIGDCLGGRDHSTVIHGINKIEKDVEKDEMTRNVVKEIMKNIKNR